MDMGSDHLKEGLRPRFKSWRSCLGNHNLQIVCSMVTSRPSRALWALLIVYVALGVGIWAISRAVDAHKAGSKAWNGCLLAGLVALALVNAALVFAIVSSRQKYNDLLDALLPDEVLESLDDDSTQASGKARIMRADTPADMLLSMVGQLLGGDMPDMRDVLFIRTVLMGNMDVYQPLNLHGHIKGGNLDADVAQNLMQQLGGDGGSSPLIAGPSLPRRSRASAVEDSSAGKRTLPSGALALSSRRATNIRSPLGGAGSLRATACSKSGSGTNLEQLQQQLQEQQDPQKSCSTLASALALILTPQPPGWAELQDTADGATAPDGYADSALVNSRDSKHAGASPLGHGLAVGPSPPSGLFEKAASLLLHRASRRRGSVDFPTLHLDSIRRGGGGSGGGGGGASALESVLGRRLSHCASVRQGVADASPILHESTGELRGRRSYSTAAAMALSEANNVMAGVPPVLKEDGCKRACTAVVAHIADVEAGGGSSNGGNPLGHSAEWLVPRRLSAVMSLFTRRGSTASLGSVAQDPSFDGGVRSACAGGGGTGGSPLDGSFSAGRNHSLQAGQPSPPPMSPWAVLAGSETAQPHHSRRGLLASSPSRAASGRYAATMTDAGSMPSFTAAGQSPMKRNMPPPIAIIEEVERLLAQSDSWQFDSWALQEASQGHALSALGFYLIQRAGLLSALRLKPVTLARLLRQVESGYAPNPYHNATHAADVLQTLHVILHAAQLHVHYLDPLGLLAAYYAAIVHDYGHPGLTSDFLIATSDPLAVRYNDRSPLENHHCAASFSLLLRPELDVLAPLSASERSAFRKQVIELVLATDMKQHFSTLSHFTTVHRLAAYSQQQLQQQQAPPAAAAAAVVANRQLRPLARKTLRRTFSRMLSMAPDGSATSYSGSPAAAFAACWSEPAPRPVDDTERLLSLQVALKVADLGHLGEALAVHTRWLDALEEEFFRQGDRERQLGLPISSLFDRAKQGVSKSQVGFYEFAALPLVHALSSAFPGTQPLMACFVANYNHWRVVDGQTPVEVQRSAEAVEDASMLGSSPRGQQQKERKEQRVESEAGVEPLGSLLLCVPDDTDMSGNNVV